MIRIDNLYSCIGCGSCVQVCPLKCICNTEDQEGFMYPQVDVNSCIDCGECDKVCPMLKDKAERKPISVYAAVHKDSDTRNNSSSGGVFSALASSVLRERGVVFGALFNNRWEVVHGYIQNEDELWRLRGSKYVQSQVGNSYEDARFFLESGKKVLFTGTPCQIAGLKSYLKKDYENLVAVDVICHGVPSPGVFRRYLLEELQKFALQGDKNSVLSHSIHGIPNRDALDDDKLRQIKGISFRDKRKGWKKFSFTLTLAKASADGKENTVLLSSTLYKNPFLRGFMKNIYLRPSCYSCHFKCFKSGSDITLGDFWGVGHYLPKMEDDRGVSAVFLNTQKSLGMNWDKCSMIETSVDYISKRNSALYTSPAIPKERIQFFCSSGLSLSQLIEKLCPLSKSQGIKNKIRSLAYNIKVLLTR